MASTRDAGREAARQLNRLSWRAAGAQFYPGEAPSDPTPLSSYDAIDRKTPIAGAMRLSNGAYAEGAGGAYDALHELSHRGRGPKGYRRSDERLREIICERLTEDPFIDASNITIDVRNGEVTVQGAVQVRQQKYAIEDLIADVSGVTEIHNHVSVASQEIEERMSGL